VSTSRRRSALIALELFVALTAVGGGIALALGAEGGRFPRSWLSGTPFVDYSAPGLILAAVVGGSATAAAIALVRGSSVAPGAAAAAGVVLVGWIVGEVVLIGADTELVSPMEALYLVVGAAMIVLGMQLGRSTARLRLDPAPESAHTAAASGQPARRLSRRERVGLMVQRALDRWLSPLGVWMYRRTKGAIAGPWKKDVLLLTTTGRRSGRRRTVVLQFFRDGDALVLAAANDGGRSHPGWYFNLMSQPVASVEVNARRLSVRAEVLPPREAADWWPRIVARDPTYVRYGSATERAIPIVRLVPLEPSRAAEG